MNQFFFTVCVMAVSFHGCGASTRSDAPTEFRPGAPAPRAAEVAPRAQRLFPEERDVERAKAMDWLRARGVIQASSRAEDIEILDLSARGLTSLPLSGLSTLPKLRELDLSRNAFSSLGSQAPRTGGFPALVTLKLSCADSPLPASFVVHVLAMAPRVRTLELQDSGVGTDHFKGFASAPLLESLAFGKSDGHALQCAHGNRVDAEALSTLTRLPALRTLSLKGLDLDDDALAPLSALQQIQHVDLSDNARSGDGLLATLGNMPNLKSLRLGDTRARTRADPPAQVYTDQGFAALSALNQLETLELKSDPRTPKAQLTSASLERLSTLRALTVLDLSYVLTRAPLEALDALGRLENLTTLRLAYDDRRSQAPFSSAFLLRLPKLRTLALTGFAIVDEDIKRISGLGNLTSLALGSSALEDPLGLAPLAALIRLEELDLSQSVVPEHDLSPLSALPNLKSLSLKTSVGAQYAQLPLFARLRALRFSSIWQSDDELAFLDAMPQLESLWIGNESESCVGIPWVTCLSDVTLERVARLRSLKELGLSGTRISAEGVAALTGLSRLETLELSHNSRITREALDPLSRLPALRSLGLSGTAISGPDILASASKFPRLSELYAEQLTSTEMPFPPLGHIRLVSRILLPSPL